MERWAILAAVLMTGCAGFQAALERRLGGLETQIGDLGRTLAAQRQQITQLEDRLMLLQDQIETRQMAAGRSAAAGIGVPNPAAPAPSAPLAKVPALEVPRSLPSVRLVPAAHEEEEAEEDSDTEHDRPPYKGRRGAEPAPARPERMVDVYATLTEDGRVVTSVSRSRSAPAGSQRTQTPRRESESSEVGEDRVLKTYREAYEAYQQGRHEEALEGFRTFLRRHPKHPYADNAQYWIGECYYDRQEWARARQEFLRVITDHPDGNKVPDAMVKVGLCDQRLEQWDEARRMYDAVLLTYPDSPAAAVALRLLGELP